MSDGPLIGSKDEYIEATLVAAREPWTCTERQFKVLESSHPAVAREARRKAAAWQQKADEAQRRVEARPAATGPLVAPPPAPDEDVKAWWQRHRGAAASVGLVKSVFDIIADFAERLKARNDGRDIQFTALEARVSALEQRPQLKDAGVWTSGQSYAPGDVVSHAGSGWICNAAHTAGGGISHEAFRLLVKRGRDGRDVGHE